MRATRPLESGRTAGLVIAAGIAAVGYLDHVTGPELGFSLFYLLPILVAARFGPPGMGYGVAVVSAAVWWYVDRLGGQAYQYPLVPLWNALIRLGMFAVIVMLLGALRRLNGTLEQRIQLKTEHVRALAADVASAEARERDRIAQLLHDDLQQQLHASQFQLARLREDVRQRNLEELEPAVDDLQAKLREATQTTRTLAGELSPPALRSDDFAAAIRWLAEHLYARHGLAVRVEAPSGFAIPEAGRRDLLFSLVRECLFNVIKHAQVDEARVTMRNVDGRIEVAVEDDGTGFDPSILAHAHSSGTGFGLRSAAQRLELFGGTLRVESGSDRRGTRITLSLPTQEGIDRAPARERRGVRPPAEIEPLGRHRMDVG